MSDGFGAAEVERLRNETPGVAHRTHLDNAGASPVPMPVLTEVLEHVRLESEIGGYEAEELRRPRIEGVYESLAKVLECDRRNVAVTENATASFVAALSAVPFREGDVILTTRNDYASNQIQYLALARRFGVEVVRAPDRPEGGADVGAVLEIVHRRRPKVVAVSHVPTSSGLVQDVGAIGEVCREKDVLYLVDACQSVGQMPVEPRSLGADFLSGTGRKFLRGPRGIGFLYVSDRALDAGLEPLFPDLHGADWVSEAVYQADPTARRFENWEFPYALVLGLGAAAEYALSLGLERIRTRAWSLASRLRSRIEVIDGIRVLDRGPTLSAIVSLQVAGSDPEDLVRALRGRGINTSSLTSFSAVLDFQDKGVEGALRISPHYFNTDEEIDRVVGALEELASR